MITLELRETECRHLKSCLESALKELRHEIARTEHREFREMLLERERVLTDVAERIPAPVSA